MIELSALLATGERRTLRDHHESCCVHVLRVRRGLREEAAAGSRSASDDDRARPDRRAAHGRRGGPSTRASRSSARPAAERAPHLRERTRRARRAWPRTRSRSFCDASRARRVCGALFCARHGREIDADRRRRGGAALHASVRAALRDGVGGVRGRATRSGGARAALAGALPAVGIPFDPAAGRCRHRSAGLSLDRAPGHDRVLRQSAQLRGSVAARRHQERLSRLARRRPQKSWSTSGAARSISRRSWRACTRITCDSSTRAGA